MAPLSPAAASVPTSAPTPTAGPTTSASAASRGADMAGRPIGWANGGQVTRYTYGTAGEAAAGTGRALTAAPRVAAGVAEGTGGFLRAARTAGALLGDVVGFVGRVSGNPVVKVAALVAAIKPHIEAVAEETAYRFYEGSHNGFIAETALRLVGTHPVYNTPQQAPAPEGQPPQQLSAATAEQLPPTSPGMRPGAPPAGGIPPGNHRPENDNGLPVHTIRALPQLPSQESKKSPATDRLGAEPVEVLAPKYDGARDRYIAAGGAEAHNEGVSKTALGKSSTHPINLRMSAADPGSKGDASPTKNKKVESTDGVQSLSAVVPLPPPNRRYEPLRMSEQYRGEEKGIFDFKNEKIHYCTTEEAKGYRVGVSQDASGARILTDSNGRPLTLMKDSNGRPVNLLEDTGRKNPIYVMDQQGNIYIREGSYNFAHSSFVRGKDVAAAGELIIKNGKIVAINDRSGHYYRDERSNVQFLSRLQQLGIDVSQIDVKDIDSGKAINGRAYLAKHDSSTPWPPSSAEKKK